MKDDNKITYTNKIHAYNIIRFCILDNTVLTIVVSIFHTIVYEPSMLLLSREYRTNQFAQ